MRVLASLSPTAVRKKSAYVSSLFSNDQVERDTKHHDSSNLSDLALPILIAATPFGMVGSVRLRPRTELVHLHLHHSLIELMACNRSTTNIAMSIKLSNQYWASPLSSLSSSSPPTQANTVSPHPSTN